MTRNSSSSGSAELLQLVLSRLHKVKRSGSGYSALCPAHDDSRASLSVDVGDDGRILVHCHAGCSQQDVASAMGLNLAQLFCEDSDAALPDKRPRPKARGWKSLEAAATGLAEFLEGSVTSIHPYPLVDGTTSFAVIRFQTDEGKTYRPVHLAQGRWRTGDPPGQLPLFGLNHLQAADEILVVEGERCAELARELGIIATTSAHGAESALKSDWTPIASKRVVIWADADAPGEGYARDVVATLRVANPQIEIRSIRIPGLADGEDIVDWRDDLRASGVAETDISERLAVLMDGAETWVETSSARSACSALGVAPGDSWPSPLPIFDSVELPPFPIATAFPPGCRQLREFVEAVAHTFQVPVDLPALLALATFGLTLSRAVEASPQPDWQEPLTLYVMVLLDSGERKSPVFKLMIGPVYDWQRQLQLSMELDIAEAENDIDILQERLNQARKDAAKGKNTKPGQSIHDLARELRDLESSKPSAPSLIATESTTEAIADVLIENKERGMLAATEADILDVMLGRYSSGRPNFGLWLSGHAGDHYEVRRKGREPIRLARPALTVALAIQPGAIQDLMSSAAAEGRGLLARFLFSSPSSIVGYRELEPAPIPTPLSDWYGARIHKLLDRPVDTDPRVLRLDDEADKLLRRLRERIEAELRPGGELASNKPWGNKLPGAIVRIAGILHGISDPDLRCTTINGETMAAAIAWAPYLLAHQRFVASQAGLDTTALVAQRILEWAHRERKTDFSRRDAFNGVRGRLARRTKDIDEALDFLQDLGWIRAMEKTPPRNPAGGRKPSPRFEVNPAASSSDDAPTTQNTHNAQNCTAADEEATDADS